MEQIALKKNSKEKQSLYPERAFSDTDKAIETI